MVKPCTIFLNLFDANTTYMKLFRQISCYIIDTSESKVVNWFYDSILFMIAY